MKGRKWHTNPWLYCLELGLAAGLLWGGLRWLLYELSFTKVLPGFMAAPFFVRSFEVTVWGHLIGWGMYIGFSVLASYIYFVACHKLRGSTWGLLYGLLWWAVVFGAGPLLGMSLPLNRMGWNSLWTELSVFVVWGLFIGYSIAFEYTDEASRESAFG